MIFTHCIDDNHHDHRATTEATMIACRPNKNITFLKKSIHLKFHQPLKN